MHLSQREVQEVSNQNPNYPASNHTSLYILRTFKKWQTHVKHGPYNHKSVQLPIASEILLFRKISLTLEAPIFLERKI